MFLHSSSGRLPPAYSKATFKQCVNASMTSNAIEALDGFFLRGLYPAPMVESYLLSILFSWREGLKGWNGKVLMMSKAKRNPRERLLETLKNYTGLDKSTLPVSRSYLNPLRGYLSGKVYSDSGYLLFVLPQNSRFGSTYLPFLCIARNTRGRCHL